MYVKVEVRARVSTGPQHLDLLDALHREVERRLVHRLDADRVDGSVFCGQAELAVSVVPAELSYTIETIRPSSSAPAAVRTTFGSIVTSARPMPSGKVRILSRKIFSLSDFAICPAR